MRLRVAAGVGLLLLATTPAPASAAGLFDLLLGGAAPSPVAAPAESGTLTVHRRHARRTAPRVARVSAKATTARAEARDGSHKAEVSIDPAKVADWYLRDRTLRRGDIVVLRDGVLVYTGRRAGEARRAGDFARLRDARFLPARTREFVAKATATNAFSPAVAAPPKPKVRPSAT